MSVVAGGGDVEGVGMGVGVRLELGQTVFVLIAAIN